MIILLSTILEDPLLVNRVILNLCVLFLLSFLEDPCNTNQPCNYLPLFQRCALPSFSTWWLVCTILLQVSHLYNPTKMLQIYWGIISHHSPFQQQRQTTATQCLITLDLKKRKQLISLPFFLYCHVLDLSTFHSMARKHYLMNLEKLLSLKATLYIERTRGK